MVIKLKALKLVQTIYFRHLATQQQCWIILCTSQDMLCLPDNENNASQGDVCYQSIISQKSIFKFFLVFLPAHVLYNASNQVVIGWEYIHLGDIIWLALVFYHTHWGTGIAAGRSSFYDLGSSPGSCFLCCMLYIKTKYTTTIRKKVQPNHIITSDELSAA